MARTFRTLMQSIAAPVLSTSLYFIVFGGAIGSRVTLGFMGLCLLVAWWLFHTGYKLRR